MHVTPGLRSRKPDQAKPESPRLEIASYPEMVAQAWPIVLNLGSLVNPATPELIGP